MTTPAVRSIECRFAADIQSVDVLLYSHDGRGLGHVSRAVAIALALRRLAPGIRLTLLTGSEWVPALAGYDRLDWIKLPSYRNQFGRGVSSGGTGPLGYSHWALREVRSALIADLMAALRPRIVVVDHYPDGKEGELLRALHDERCVGTQWWLGLRAIVGLKSRIWSSHSGDLVNRRYAGVLWYGDPEIAGVRDRLNIGRHFTNVPVVEAGYVSRAVELSKANALVPLEDVEGLTAVFCDSDYRRI